MIQCRSEGELRAYLDRELPGLEMEAVAEHVAGCGACRDALAEMSQRAERVLALMDELQYGGPATLPAGRGAWRWVAAAGGLAACLALAFILTPKRAEQQATATVSKLAPQVNASVPFSGAADLKPASKPAPGRRQPRARKPDVEYFLALDDEPIEMGVIQRVALGPAEVPADVVFSPDGRARAIRLVSYSGVQGGR
jgi:anti-sigma-K factor RskA